eukprot:3674505-Prymnesium_polylepis.2
MREGACHIREGAIEPNEGGRDVQPVVPAKRGDGHVKDGASLTRRAILGRRPPFGRAEAEAEGAQQERAILERVPRVVGLTRGAAHGSKSSRHESARTMCHLPRADGSAILGRGVPYQGGTWLPRLACARRGTVHSRAKAIVKGRANES